MATRRPANRRSPRTAVQAQRLLDLLNALGSTTFRQLLWQRASELDLTYAQSQVLFYVGDHPACHMGDVGKAFNVRSEERRVGKECECRRSRDQAEIKSGERKRRT